MIFVVSTSSPLASIAFISLSGDLVWSGSLWSPNSATEAVFTLCEESKRISNLVPTDCQYFCADTGPGSFTGVRIGVVIAKMFALSKVMSMRKDKVKLEICAGLVSFDLLANTVQGDIPLAVPSRKNEWWIRIDSGSEPVKSREFPEGGIGWGDNLASNTYPMACNATTHIKNLSFVSPELLLPQYLSEPSISIPKRNLAQKVR